MLVLVVLITAFLGVGTVVAGIMGIANSKGPSRVLFAMTTAIGTTLIVAAFFLPFLTISEEHHQCKEAGYEWIRGNCFEPVEVDTE